MGSLHIIIDLFIYGDNIQLQSDYFDVFSIYIFKVFNFIRMIVHHINPL